MTLDLIEKKAKDSGHDEDVRQYLQEIRQYPRLTVDEERQLAMLCAQGNEEAIRKMVNCNLRLVVSVAREYAGRGVPLLDLIQEGSIGLLAAAKKFDYTLEFRFSTYATKWIRQGITRCLMNHGLIRVPAHTAERIRKVIAVKAALQQATGTEPAVEEIARACDMTAEKVTQLLELNPQTVSLDAPTGEDDDSTLGLLLENVRSAQPYEELVRQELLETLEHLLAALNERQQQVLRLHFGMVDGTCHSLEQISRHLGVSKERVRQIEQQAIAKLQKLGSSMGLEDFLS